MRRARLRRSLKAMRGNFVNLDRTIPTLPMSTYCNSKSGSVSSDNASSLIVAAYFATAVRALTRFAHAFASLICQMGRFCQSAGKPICGVAASKNEYPLGAPFFL